MVFRAHNIVIMASKERDAAEPLQRFLASVEAAAVYPGTAEEASGLLTEAKNALEVT